MKHKRKKRLREKVPGTWMRLLSNGTRDYNVKSFWCRLEGWLLEGWLSAEGWGGDRREPARLTCLKRGLELFPAVAPGRRGCAAGLCASVLPSGGEGVRQAPRKEAPPSRRGGDRRDPGGNAVQLTVCGVRSGDERLLKSSTVHKRTEIRHEKESSGIPFWSPIPSGL